MYKGKPVVLEGGAIDSNGRVLLTSEECLMHPNIQVRNVVLPKKIMKLYLKNTESPM
jgi:agmatine deiminase